MKRLIVLLNIGIFCALSRLDAQEIIIAVDQGNPPFMFEQDGEAVGIYPVLLSTIFQQMGVEMVVKAYPWRRALKMGESGEVGIGGIYKTKERLQIYDYSDPLYTENIFIYVKQDRTFSFDELDDLEGKVIGTLLGWSYGDAFDNFQKEGRAVVTSVKSDSINFQMLLHGRVDCVLALEAAANMLIMEEGYEDLFVRLEKPVAVNETYLVFAKNSRRRQLLDRFNTFLQTVKEDGTYEELIDTYLE